MTRYDVQRIRKSFDDNEYRINVRDSVVMNYAVLVGINKYEQYATLNYARSDAKALRDTLLFAGGGRFSADTVRLLIEDDEAFARPTRANLFVALSQMCKDASDGDLILLYFAGHGFDVNETSYLVTSDTHPAVLRETAVTVGSALQMMKDSKALKKVLLLDACRKFAEPDASRSATPTPGATPRTFSKSLHRALERQAQQPGWEIISSCAPDQWAWESDELGGGVWTHFAIQTIETLRSESASITVSALFAESQKSLKEWIGATGRRKQTPYYKCDSAESAVLIEPPQRPGARRATVSDLCQAMLECGVRVVATGADGHRTTTDRWNPNSEEPSVHIVPFRSGVERPDLAHTPDELVHCNQEFYLRVYLPSLRGDPPFHDRVYLLFNGLGEASASIYDDIGWELARRKRIPSVLIPFPLHLARDYQFPCKPQDPYLVKSNNMMRLTTQRILQRLAGKPSGILHGYNQILADGRALLRTIKVAEHPYWKLVFDSESTVSLFGYALGGFVPLALLLDEPERYGSLFLMESGPFMDQIDGGALFVRGEPIQKLLWDAYFEKREPLIQQEMLFSPREAGKEQAFRQALDGKDSKALHQYGNRQWSVFERTREEGREVWRDMILDLYRAIETECDLMTAKDARVFRMLVLGYESVICKKLLEKLAQQILIITGGSDEIFPTRLLLNAGPDTGLAILQIPAISHWIEYGSRASFPRWTELLIDLMETFPKWRLPV